MSKFRILSVDELIRELDGFKFSKFHVHHCWKPDHSNFNGKNHIKLQENMKHYHTKNLGWSDIGQHVSLAPDGKFITGRPFNKTPSSIANDNTGAFCMEMIGNFDKGKDVLNGEQKLSALKLTNYFQKRGCRVTFHNEKSSKSCPGSGIIKSTFLREATNLDTSQEVVSIDNLPNYTISIKSRGADVKAVQSALKELGYKLDVDGIYGEGTKSAILSFQKKCGNLDVDGIYGKATKVELEKALKQGDSNVTEVVEDKEKGGKNMTLDFKEYQWDMLIDILTYFCEDINSDEWLQKAKDKTMTLSELTFLNLVLLQRSRQRDNK